MSTSTTRLGLYKPTSSENVNVVTDLNNNLDSIDLNMSFRSCTSSTRPSVVWDGLNIHETDTNRFYVWNATPASSGWYELYSTGGTISQINLSGATSGAFTLTSKTSGKAQPQYEIRADGVGCWGDGTAAVDTFLYRSGVNALKTDGSFQSVGALTTTSTTDSTALSVSGGATISKSLTVGGAASLGGAQGALGIKNITTAPTATPASGLLLTSEGGRPRLYSSAGSEEYLGGACALSSTPTTVVNTVSETSLGQITLPANDAVVGTVYRLSAWGVASVTGTPTLRFRIWFGASGFAQTGAFTTSSGVTNKIWNIEILLTCLGTGNPGSWAGVMNCSESISVAGANPTTAAVRLDGAGTFANATTTTNTLNLMATWGTASVSNTVTCRGFLVTRVA
jgi:hypothetical protein